jgi:hypothetical protein
VPRACVFCQRERKLTLEHVIPDWIGRHLADATGATDVTHTQRLEGQDVRSWTTGALEVRVRRVCEDCNTGWMSRLEGVARPVLLPLIAGRSRGLSPTEQKTIAVWAIKTALMCEFIHPPSRGATEDQFQTIYKKLEPTTNAHVWLSHYVGSKDVDYNHRNLFINPVDAPQLPGPGRKGYLSALIINRLVLYVLDVEGQRTWHELSKDTQRAFLQIQPVKWVFPRWPPPVPVDDESIESFLHVFAPIQVGSSAEKG